MNTHTNPALYTSAAERRQLLAHFLAINSLSPRPLSSEQLGGLLGIKSGLIRTEWRRADVRDMSHALACRGFSAVIAATLRVVIIEQAARARDGDLGAARFLVDAMERAGVLADVFGAGALPSADECGGLIAPSDVFGGIEAVEELARLLGGSDVLASATGGSDSGEVVTDSGEAGGKT